MTTVRKVGDEAFGTIITAREIPSGKINDITYEVQYQCCLTLGRLKHRSLLRRGKLGQNLCPTCAQLASRERKEQAERERERKEQAKRPPLMDNTSSFAQPPLWPVPPTVRHHTKSPNGVTR